jgi:hypothetical protein
MKTIELINVLQRSIYFESLDFFVGGQVDDRVYALFGIVGPLLARGS